MSPQERQEFNALKKLVETLLKAENVVFIQNLNRRLEVDGNPSSKGATVENVSINEAGVATKTALGAPDGFIMIGNVNIPYYN